MLPSSKLGIEMMRANSHDSVAVMSDSNSTVVTPSKPERVPPARTPPEATKTQEKNEGGQDPEETPRPSDVKPAVSRAVSDDPTPRPSVKKPDTATRFI